MFILFSNFFRQEYVKKNQLLAKKKLEASKKAAGQLDANNNVVETKKAN